MTLPLPPILPLGSGSRYSEGEPGMINLTRLNNSRLAVNSDLVKFVEQAPDTVITLITGEKIVVRESADEVLGRILDFRRSVVSGALIAGETSPSALARLANSSKLEGKGRQSG
jgi:flagellar protein FlbD